MKKLTLLGAAQSPKQSVFQIEKKNHCVETIRSFLQELGFASWDTAKLFGPLGGGDTGKPSMKYTNAAYDDRFFAMQKGQYTVQVFFGKKKVTISVLTTDDVREQLLLAIRKYTDGFKSS